MEVVTSNLSYAVGIILSAVAALQASTLHPDVIHATAHYLQPLDVAACEVRVRRIREGKNLANIDADLIQNGKTRIAARLVYGVLPDISLTSSSDHLTLAAPSPLARRVPLTQHPARMTPDAPHSKFIYQIKAEDRNIEKRNAAKAQRRPTRSASADDRRKALEPPDSENGGLEWAAWIQLSDSGDAPLEATMMPLFADLMKNLPVLLPRECQPEPSWFATVVLTVEFRSRIPAGYSPRTLGLYSSARFMSAGRHDAVSSPAKLEHRAIDEDWREKQVCLAVSTQMALTIPDTRSPKKIGSRL
ncbi:hypothetical protein EW145_g5089 [Phellinidium pouzarii]|uniref:Acyl-CoA thioesterase-like N-terminal HotDog domain-containing protein n=1 Tax=Phellinidium pouzarii TaxID=167371 RepID=A0A4S4L335_9AGAM|nr:hypothetical protein EW145_g5089 [Phellinidium pouzarii]